MLAAVVNGREDNEAEELRLTDVITLSPVINMLGCKLAGRNQEDQEVQVIVRLK